MRTKLRSYDHLRLRYVFAISALVALPTITAQAQSFDCRAARTTDEITICENGQLARLDQQLATTYRRSVDALGDDQRQAFQQNEVAFINAHRRCGEDDRCIAQSYRNRIQELQNLLSQSDRDEGEGIDDNNDRQARRAEQHGTPKTVPPSRTDVAASPPPRPPEAPMRATVTTVERVPEASGSTMAALHTEPGNSAGSANEEQAGSKRPAKHREAKRRHAAKTATAATTEAPPVSPEPSPPAASVPLKPTIQWANPPPAR